jgi:hypothetical protein
LKQCFIIKFYIEKKCYYRTEVRNNILIKISHMISQVPGGRPSATELRAMALRQQQQIDSQHQVSNNLKEINEKTL